MSLPLCSCPCLNSPYPRAYLGGDTHDERKSAPKDKIKSELSISNSGIESVPKTSFKAFRKTLFSTASYLPLIHGSNELQLVLTVNDESIIKTMGTVCLLFTSDAADE